MCERKVDDSCEVQWLGMFAIKSGRLGVFATLVSNRVNDVLSSQLLLQRFPLSPEGDYFSLPYIGR